MIILDIDNDRAYRAFVRYISGSIDAQHLIGVGATKRGWHVWLSCASDGWTVGSVGQWLKGWLGRKDLYGIEYRVGSGSFVVWPEGGDGRHWVPLDEFAARVAADWVDVPARALNDAWGAPWMVEESETLRQVQGQFVHGNEPVDTDDLEMSTSEAWAKFEKGITRLAKTGSGNRNNVLNQVAYYQGSALVFTAGEDVRGQVMERLVEAYPDKSYQGVQATIESGLRAGLSRLAAAAEAATT